MKFMNKKNHMIDFIFPVTLLFVFAVSALVVTLFAANVYQGTVEDSSRNSIARTSLAYVTEKIHSGDQSGNVHVAEFNGRDAVKITEKIDGEEYVTYIYYFRGEIRELFIKSGSRFTAASGTKILKVKDFEIRKKSDDIIQLICTDNQGETASGAVSIKSR